MNSKNDSINWKYLILQVFVTVIGSAFITALLSYFSLESVNIRISDSVQTTKGYATVVSITNYTKKTIDDISLYLSGECNIDSVTSEKTYDISTNTVSNITLMPKQDINFLLNTSTPVIANEFFAQSSSKIKVDYSSEPIQNLYTYLISFFVLAIFFGGSTYFTMRIDQKRRKELSEELQKKISEIEEELRIAADENTKINQGRDDINKRISALQKSQVEQRIFYQLRIRDLCKELDFWKDTIRKLMYSARNKTIASDIIISTVTKELKTFTVLEKSSDNIDEIFYLAKQIAKEKGDITD